MGKRSLCEAIGNSKLSVAEIEKKLKKYKKARCHDRILSVEDAPSRRGGVIGTMTSLGGLLKEFGENHVR